MCRWIAYDGAPLLMEELILKPEHSLIVQSLASTEGAEPTNGDGFGVGWYDDQATPGVYKSIEPAWNDRNLTSLAKHIRSHLFIAHVRATTGTPIQQTNCHPFTKSSWLFVHNGVLAFFQPMIPEDIFKERRQVIIRINALPVVQLGEQFNVKGEGQYSPGAFTQYYGCDVIGIR